MNTNSTFHGSDHPTEERLERTPRRRKASELRARLLAAAAMASGSAFAVASGCTPVDEQVSLEESSAIGEAKQALLLQTECGACPYNMSAYINDSEWPDGLQLRCHCPAADTQYGNVWGTDVYTGDSSICRAALHAGAVSTSGGTVLVTKKAAQESYVGSVRNGVSSTSYTPYEYSFTVEGLGNPECPIDLIDFVGNPGDKFKCFCSPARTADGTVIGTGSYMEQSSICRAALHAGAVDYDTGGTIEVTVGQAQTSFTGSTANGVTSTDWGYLADAFSVARAPGLCNDCPVDLTAYNAPADINRLVTCDCQPSSFFGGNVYGTNKYTNDSRLCAAALHAGIIPPTGGYVEALIQPGESSYTGSTQNGITSASWGSYPTSYIFAQPFSMEATNVGVMVHDLTAGALCNNKPRMVDLWVGKDNGWEFHDRCFTNVGADPNSGVGLCMFKYTMPTTDPLPPASPILVRTWNIDSNCNTMDYAPFTPGVHYTDRYVTKIVADTRYDANKYSRLTTLSTSKWQAKVDRNGGTIYEFVNLRAQDPTLAPGKHENVLHAHSGGALQFSTHSGDFFSLTNHPCAGGGYWNPTQAGADCTYANGVYGGPVSVAPGYEGLHVYCDGVLNDTCTSASSTLEHTRFHLMNWDYGPSDPPQANYEGPFNPADTGYLQQKITVNEHYMQVDAAFDMAGAARDGLLETPTFYFNNRFRRYFVPNGSSVEQVDIPYNLTGLDTDNYFTGNHISTTERLPWITFQNPETGVVNQYITLATFEGATLAANKNYNNWVVKELLLYDNIKFVFAPDVHMQQGLLFKWRYVVFPYKYDEIITTSFGTMSVKDTIAAMRAAYTD